VVAYKQKQTLIVTVFPIASRNAPKTAKSRCPVCDYGVLDMVLDFANDEVPDSHDRFPKIIDKRVPGLCGCGEADTRSDSDEVPDCDDEYPQDPAKTLAGK
jgi:hypothetical protein